MQLLIEKAFIRLYKALFLRPIARRFNQLLFRCAAHGLGLMNYRNLKESGEDMLIKRLLPLKLSEKCVLLDIGANVGNYSILLRSSFAKARIIAFEPHPPTFATLEENIRGLGIELVNEALSDKSGFSPFFVTDRQDLSSKNTMHQSKVNSFSELCFRETQVAATTIDEFVEEKQIEIIDFLKIDTEGHELAILSGAQNTLAAGRIRFIQFEFNELQLVAGSRMLDFRKMLPNYTFYRLSPRGLIFLPDRVFLQEIYQFQNIFCVPESEL